MAVKNSLFFYIFLYYRNILFTLYSDDCIPMLFGTARPTQIDESTSKKVQNPVQLIGKGSSEKPCLTSSFVNKEDVGCYNVVNFIIKAFVESTESTVKV